ncbi:hypothetical protein B0T24DRAFT_691890 [Lasiosphaeria ovina]|uniref:Uncharacterized protein n=1 Tax=Lasiosphaeria ovina TaxID=92902 RepID=A0AAE0MYJ8_9PEZI|nr:hypothetical protein B0T24DRAFT_691890 [Lasiosphaeria ovina]
MASYDLESEVYKEVYLLASSGTRAQGSAAQLLDKLKLTPAGATTSPAKILVSLRDMFSWTCLHYAAVRGNEEMISELCGEVKKVLDDVTLNSWVNAMDTCARGDTALHVAAREMHVGACAALRQHGGQPAKQNREGQTAEEIVQAVVRKGQRTLQAMASPPEPVHEGPSHGAAVSSPAAAGTVESQKQQQPRPVIAHGTYLPPPVIARGTYFPPPVIARGTYFPPPPPAARSSGAANPGSGGDGDDNNGNDLLHAAV